MFCWTSITSSAVVSNPIEPSPIQVTVCRRTCVYYRTGLYVEESMTNDQSRRAFLATSGLALAGLVAWRWRPVGHLAITPGAPKLVTIVEFSDAGDRKGVVSVPMVEKTDAEWKAQLSPQSYEVTRHADTEYPFTGALLKVHDKGVFRCICCDTAV